MTTEDTFLVALLQDPTDELTWLALADWLEENGQSSRAEMVRIGRQLRKQPVMKRTKKRVQLEARLAELVRVGTRPVVPQIVNSIGMRLSLIEPGKFRMGSPRSEAMRKENETVREVTLTTPYFIGVHQVTQGQYAAIMGNNPSDFSRTGGGSAKAQPFTDAELKNFPVEMVSYNDACSFMQQLSSREEGLIYRPPTEAEWEYACRAGSSLPFHVGEELTGEDANFDGECPYPRSAKASEGRNRPMPVGSFLPNAWGLYDMHGNVWEWCYDSYGEYPPGPVTNPLVPASSTQTVRGAGFLDYAEHCRAAYRTGCSGPRFHVGFRVVAER